MKSINSNIDYRNPPIQRCDLPIIVILFRIRFCTLCETNTWYTYCLRRQVLVLHMRRFQHEWKLKCRNFLSYIVDTTCFTGPGVKIKTVHSETYTRYDTIEDYGRSALMFTQSGWHFLMNEMYKSSHLAPFALSYAKLGLPTVSYMHKALHLQFYADL